MAAISTYILTFNCGCTHIPTESFSSSLFNGLSSPKSLPDILVLNLQEIAPIPQSLIGGSFLLSYFTRFHNAVQLAAQRLSDSAEEQIYTPIAARNLGMTGIMVFGLSKELEKIRDVETAGVGVGLWEMGNKGAVGVRFKYRDTEFTFVSAHLAAMEGELARRNEDYKNVCRGLVFGSGATDGKTTGLAGEERPLLSVDSHDAGMYKSTSYLFFGGDLNYRTSLLSPSPNDHIESFPQPHHEPSHANHYSELFKSDQLMQERKAGRTCHGLQEARITFPPTYKYDPERQGKDLGFGKGTEEEEVKRWHWAKHRWPSWCDRILYLDVPVWVSRERKGAKLSVGKYSALPLFPTSDHRPVTLELSVPAGEIPKPTEDEEGEDPRINPPFEIDIDWKRKRERARMLEVLVGFVMYFTTTWEGGGVLVAMVVGAVGSVYAFKAILES